MAVYSNSALFKDMGAISDTTFEWWIH